MDLARLAGVSAQQIRNYADAGILPPVPRSAVGYRRFGDPHRRALLAYRALAKGSTPVRAREIMRAVHAGDAARALALVDACHAELHERRRTLQATRRALEVVAGTLDPARHASLSIGDLAAQLQVRTSGRAAPTPFTGRSRTGTRRSPRRPGHSSRPPATCTTLSPVHQSEAGQKPGPFGIMEP